MRTRHIDELDLFLLVDTVMDSTVNLFLLPKGLGLASVLGSRLAVFH